jgi:lactate dehydrogenase-like 2-hydroxyacid dehydrogenase
MSRPRLIVVTIPGMLTLSDLELLEAHVELAYVELAHVTSDELAELCWGQDYLMLNWDVVTELPASFYDHPAVCSLRLIALDTTGFDWATPHAAQAAGVALSEVRDYSTNSVAETFLGEALIHAHGIHAAYRDAVIGTTPALRQGFDLANKRAGIVGLGHIGQRMAQLCIGLGMEVVAWSRTPRPGYRMVSLEELFETSTLISITVACVHEGPGTNVHMVAADLLDRCRGAIILNPAKDAIIDNAAMARAIKEGRVLGYSVEMTDELGRSELTTLDPVHLMPKCAWYTPESLALLRRGWVRTILDDVERHTPR